MDKNEHFNVEINNIKNDISIIRNNIDNLSLAFTKHIQEHPIVSASSAKQNDNSKIAVLDNNLEIPKCNLIDYSFIENEDKNKSLLEIVSNSDKNMSSCYQSNFLQFCFCAVGLVEDVIKIFLEKKFIDIEEGNDSLLKACDLLEREYQKKTWNFPNIYISKNQYNPHEQDTSYTYNSNKEEYLSLTKLKRADIIFTLELSFVTLYGADFYKKNYILPRRVNLQPSSKALKRPSAKLPSSLEPLNKEFYSYIDHARQFRNIIVHNKNNIKAQEQELQQLLSKKRYLKKTENNYDGIVESVTCFIRQVYIAMKT